ncbi:hypothetical protein CRG98_021756 [Punica granatum]|uniref:Uncharacterized protein n=1 Tax=Punica granatum TaxID=22663 RepID=A0A2I0JPM7_PUNGR|nr:hypothetical protein CRG98_021756 [Punica granatum]
MGVKGVIVDFVREITAAVSDFISSSAKEAREGEGLLGKSKGDEEAKVAKPQFSQHELSFLFKLIPELIQASVLDGLSQRYVFPFDFGRVIGDGRVFPMRVQRKRIQALPLDRGGDAAWFSSTTGHKESRFL